MARLEDSRIEELAKRYADLLDQMKVAADRAKNITQASQQMDKEFSHRNDFKTNNNFVKLDDYAKKTLQEWEDLRQRQESFFKGIDQEDQDKINQKLADIRREQAKNNTDKNTKPLEQISEEERRKIQAIRDRAQTREQKDAIDNAAETAANTGASVVNIQNKAEEVQKQDEAKKEESDYLDQKKRGKDEEVEKGDKASNTKNDVENLVPEIPNLEEIYDYDSVRGKLTVYKGDIDLDLSKVADANISEVDFTQANLSETKSITLPPLDESFTFSAGDSIKPKVNFKGVEGVQNMDIHIDKEGLEKITLPDNLEELKLDLPQKPSDNFELSADWKNLKKLDLSGCHPDFLSEEFLDSIHQQNPNLEIVLPQSVKEQENNYTFDPSAPSKNITVSDPVLSPKAQQMSGEPKPPKQEQENNYTFDPSAPLKNITVSDPVLSPKAQQMSGEPKPPKQEQKNNPNLNPNALLPRENEDTH